MRNLFKNKVLEAILVVLVTLFIFQYIIAPGLTAASSITNIIAMLASLFGVFALFKYFDSIKGSGLIDKNELKEAERLLKEKQIGETELDYVPKPKRKSSKKSEFPIEAHNKTVKSTKTKLK